MASHQYDHTARWDDQPTGSYFPSPPPAPSAMDKPLPQPYVEPAFSPFDDRAYPLQYQSRPYGYPRDDDSVPGADGRTASPTADNIPLTQHAPTSGWQEPYAKGRPPFDSTFDEGNTGDGENARADEARKKRRRQRQRRGSIPRGRTPWFVYAMTLVQVTVFLAEIAKNAVLTHSPIMIHPSFSPMIGPSTYVLINMGARFVPCMRSTPGVQDSQTPIQWPCPNTTSSDLSNPSMHCTLSELCGFSGVPNPHVGGKLTDQPQPNQWFRFIVPIFLHAGLIHIAFNMLLQLTLGRDMEKAIGPLRLALVYFSSGIFGFVMGGNFAPSGIASTGASGSLFGVLALTMLDLLYNWNQRSSPGKDLAFLMLDVIISFFLGLLPGLDNFSHIGGFCMGLVLGICLLHSPSLLRERTGEHKASSVDGGLLSFVRHPLAFFQGRKPFWWVWWLFRAGALIGVLASFIVLLNNFYTYRNQCKWCKYLSCLPVRNWCDIGNLHLTTEPATT